MHIVNIMMSRGQGGIEQAFVDYCQALVERGHTVTAITTPRAAVGARLEALGVKTLTLRNINQWDILAILRLRGMLRSLAPDAVIGHGIRAYTLGRRATRHLCPMVGVTHNYSTKRLHDADGVFATTQPLMERLLAEGMAPPKIFFIPNMIRVHERPQRGAWPQLPVIGAMGRLVHKKGFEVYIDALAVLKARGYAFKAVLGGAGEEEASLKKRATAMGLDERLTFSGWVDDKGKFFSNIDIFCLPSLHEPFGIVLLEAFAHGVPVVSSDSEGPQDIILPDVDALMVEKGNPEALADALARLLGDPTLGEKLTGNAYAKVKAHYAMDAVSVQMEKALALLLSGIKRRRRI